MINLPASLKLFGFIALACLLSTASLSRAGDITLAWDRPTTNEDGTALIDLAGYRVRYAPLVVAYSESNSVLNWLVVSTGAVTTVWTTNTTLKLTPVSTVYAFSVTAVAGLGVESAPSSNLLARVGLPTTLKLQRVK